MTQATLKLADDKFGRSAARLVYGQFCVQINESCFPGPGWSDFVVIVLTWWCRAVAELLNGERGPIQVRFMEGPYLAELGPLEGSLLHLVLVEAGLNRRICREANVEIGPLIESALWAADRTLMECKNRGWWSRDADELAEARDKLRREISRRLN